MQNVRWRRKSAQIRCFLDSVEDMWAMF